MAKSLLAVAGFLALTLASCGSDQNFSSESAAEEESLSLLDSSVVAEIQGNDGHNLLAREDRLGRAMALANVVKTIENKEYCSPRRTLYRGHGDGTSFWALECHDGAQFQVSVKRDGSGAVLNCELSDKIIGRGDCWKKFEEK